MPRGERLRSQASGIVMNVYHYFEKMQSKAKNCATSLSPLKRTSLATGILMLNTKLCYGLSCLGISVRSVSQLLVKAGEGASFQSPKKRYEKSRKRIVADDFDRAAIRRKIHQLYEEKKHLTLRVICSILKADALFSGERSSLAKLLKDMGFGYKKINNKRCIANAFMYI